MFTEALQIILGNDAITEDFWNIKQTSLRPYVLLCIRLVQNWIMNYQCKKKIKNNNKILIFDV